MSDSPLCSIFRAFLKHCRHTHPSAVSRIHSGVTSATQDPTRWRPQRTRPVVQSKMCNLSPPESNRRPEVE